MGDTNYENFCNAGKKIHARLLEMGAKEFYARGLADDANGLVFILFYLFLRLLFYYYYYYFFFG